MTKPVYLDYAAATPLDSRVKKAMETFWDQQFYNPSATYMAGRAAKQALDQARMNIAKTLGSKASEIIFTAGATEANNLVIQGVMRQFPEAEMVVSAIEHDSVLEPANLFNSREIPVNNQGIIKLDVLERLINDNTVFVSIIFVNNELGTIQPLQEVGNLIRVHLDHRRQKGIKLPLYLHTDAAQAPNYLNLQPSRLGVDMLTINGSKIYGPKQTGALFIKAGIKLQPLILGGGQEMGLRSGTENLPGAAGLAKALELAQHERSEQAERTRQLKKEFINRLEKKIPIVVINGSQKHSSPHVVNVSFPGFDNERLMMELDERGIIVATGSACSAEDSEPSHVLRAIGLSDKQARSCLRFSFGRQTSKTNIKLTVDTIKDLTSSDR
jgi:cysteine desulfurase